MVQNQCWIAGWLKKSRPGIAVAVVFAAISVLATPFPVAAQDHVAAEPSGSESGSADGSLSSADSLSRSGSGLGDESGGVGATAAGSSGAARVASNADSLNGASGGPPGDAAAPMDLASLRSMAAAHSEPNPEQMRRLCAGIAARHLGPQEIEAAAASLGLSQDQLAQLKACAAGHPYKAEKSTTETAPAAPEAPAQSGPKGESSIEAAFRGLSNPIGRVSLPAPEKLEQFGYSLFAHSDRFPPLANVPVSQDYVLGPGDSLKVMVWGRFNNTLDLKVENDGSMLIRDIGPVQVAGLTFEQAKKMIEGRIKQITGIQATITMGQVRTIQVFVVGKVVRPGLYSVSSFSHVSNALAMAGGISKVGSLRNIQLRRKDQVVATVDLYDVLLRGSTACDIALKQGDVIFVPVIGPVVGVIGDVKVPAIFELKGREDLPAVLKTAGGVGAFGYSERVQVKRVSNHQHRVVCDVRLNNIGSERFTAIDGDLIKVFTVLPREHDAVTLKGNVNRPGMYQWRPGMRVSDLVEEGEGLADHTFFGYAVVRRVEGVDQRVRYMPLNLGAALSDSSGSANLPLRARDQLIVYNEQDLGELPQVSVKGAVRKPGSFPLAEGMRVSDLVFAAGGVKDNAYLNRAELVRTEVANGATRYIYQDVQLEDALKNDSSSDPLLRRGDRLLVQQASNWHEPWTVTIKGEVLRPGPYVVREGERLDSVFRRCGGLTWDAYLPAAVLVRKSVKEMEQKRLDESRARLQEAMARLSLMPSQLSDGDQNNRQTQMAMIQQVLGQAESRQAVGRVVVHMTTLSALPGTDSDVILKDGDEITIPKRPESVAVLGQVYNPSAIIYQSGRTLGEYLQMAGGPNEWADPNHIYLVRADGEIVTDESVRHSGKAALFPILPAISNGIYGVYLDRGDTVYVPEKLIYVDRLKVVTSVTQIIANTAMSLGMIGILAANL